MIVGVLSFPLGVAAAIYLTEYARDSWVNRLLQANMSNLAGVPSIIYGILGLALFVRLLGLGPTALSAGLTMTLLILPVVIIASIEALRAVPDPQREGAYALGASRWQMVSRSVFPAAAPGIMTGLILAMARAIGEAAPLLLSARRSLSRSCQTRSRAATPCCRSRSSSGQGVPRRTSRASPRRRSS